MARSKDEVARILKDLLPDVRRFGGRRTESLISEAIQDVRGGKWHDITDLLNEQPKAWSVKGEPKFRE